MKRLGFVLALTLTGCAHQPSPRAAPPLPESAGGVAKPSCVIPSPPTAAALAAAPGLIGRDALLAAYAKEAGAAKRACTLTATK
jgi:hypothetical protein